MYVDLRMISDSICDGLTGQCVCKKYTMGQKCDMCKAGYYRHGEDEAFGCLPCLCDTRGTLSSDKSCNQVISDGLANLYFWG